MLPNFLHIGAAKAASGWLYRVCQEHPDIYVPASPDNANFFTVHYHRGLEWYERTYFAGAKSQRAGGEFSNSYMVYPPALERIARHLPGVKLTMTLRAPIEALFLAWAHNHLKKKKYGFDARQGIGVPIARFLHHHGHAWFRHYVDPYFYARHLEGIYRLFPKANVLVMIYDDLRENSGEFLRRFFEFLDVDAGFKSTLLGVDVNADAADATLERWVAPELREEFRQVFRPDVERLQEIVGRDLSRWLA
jgi:hypothetical protein